MSLPKEWSLQTAMAEYTDLENESGCVDVNNLSENTLTGSLFSIHSAPVCEVNIEANSPKRPSSIVIPVLSSGNQHIISPDTIDDDDNLLTISSLTAKPLIAKSKELRLIKAKEEKQKKKKSENKNDDDDGEAPDGGYGWVVVFGAFFVQFWVAGLVKSYGVLFVEVMETYSDSSAAVASWIPALLSALCLALGKSNFHIYMENCYSKSFKCPPCQILA